MTAPRFSALALLPLAVAGLAALAGCAASRKHPVQQNAIAQPSPEGSKPSNSKNSTDTSHRPVHSSEPSKNSTAGGLQSYIAQAMEQSPELRASFERWQASVHRISRSQRLPDPVVSFGYFVQAVETRVGPQRARLSLKQSFPWPTKLSAGADSASAQARAQQKRFDALALAVTRSVSDLYWRLWLVRETRKIHTEHLKVVRSLSESALARVATGATTLADLQQINLSAARLEDMVRGMDEKEISAMAQLRARIGLTDTEELPTPEQPPEVQTPSASRDSLQASASKHPLIESYGLLALAQDEKARSEEATGLPTFTVGVDWIITGEARTADIQDSGKDALVLGAGMSVPLWRGSYSDSVDAAHAEASAQRSERQAAVNRATAELDSSLAAVRDAVRRVKLYRHTLVPQADSAYTSVLGAYATGRASVAQALIAQSTLLSLREELEQARAEYAQSWARLEQVVGQEVQATAIAGTSKPAQHSEQSQ